MTFISVGENRWRSRSRKHQLFFGGGPDGWDVYSLFTCEPRPKHLGHFDSIHAAETFLRERGLE